MKKRHKRDFIPGSIVVPNQKSPSFYEHYKGKTAIIVDTLGNTKHMLVVFEEIKKPAIFFKEWFDWCPKFKHITFKHKHGGYKNVKKFREYLKTVLPLYCTFEIGNRMFGVESE